MKELIDKFKSQGFYDWPLMKYFLYEYNAALQSKSKTDRSKIIWSDFIESKSDYFSVEHIWPQQARHPTWVQNFGHLNQKQKVLVRNSLGNLLPLSRAKNASLSNKPFSEKARSKDGNTVSYQYGSFAENEISHFDSWTPERILERGLRLLEFMESRWELKLGTIEDKTALLGMQGIVNRAISDKLQK